MNVYDDAGNFLADVPVSENQIEKLNAGMTVRVRYQTPRMLRGIIADVSGEFLLSLDALGAKTATPLAVSDYLGLQSAVQAEKDLQAAKFPPIVEDIKPL